MKNDYIININGEIYSGADAKISVFDRGFLYGDSVYETTRTFNQKAFRLEAHLERLFDSANKIGLTPTLSKEEIQAAINKTIAESHFLDATLRIVLTRGNNSDLGLDPALSFENNLIIFTKKITPNPTSWMTEGVSLTFFQKSEKSKGALPKTGNYQENILAYKHAINKNYFDSLMINTEGFITEATTSNAWIIKDNIVYTPPLSDGVLGGLTRKTILEIESLGLLGIKIIEKSLTKEDFLAGDECFITSTTRCVVPVTKIENTFISKGKAGHLSLEILKRYLEFVH